VHGHELLQHEKKKKNTEESEVVSSCRVTEVWWDSSHDWSTTMGGYRFLRKHRLGMGGKEIMQKGSLNA